MKFFIHKSLLWWHWIIIIVVVVFLVISFFFFKRNNQAGTRFSVKLDDNRSIADVVNCEQQLTKIIASSQHPQYQLNLNSNESAWCQLLKEADLFSYGQIQDFRSDKLPSNISTLEITLVENKELLNPWHKQVSKEGEIVKTFDVLLQEEKATIYLAMPWVFENQPEKASQWANSLILGGVYTICPKLRSTIISDSKNYGDHLTELIKRYYSPKLEFITISDADK